METDRSTSTGRVGRTSLVPWELLETHAPTAFTVAGASLLASLFAPFALLAVLDRPWLAGIALAGVAVVAAALGLLGLQPRTGVESPGLSIAGAAFATTAGVAGLVVVALTGLAGAAGHVSGPAFSIGRRAFVALAATMATGYGLGFLSFGIAARRSRSVADRVGPLLLAGGALLLLPVGGGLLQLGSGLAVPAWIVFVCLGLAAADTLAVGHGLRSTG